MNSLKFIVQRMINFVDGLTVSQLMAYILGLLLLAVTLGVQEVREEKQFDDYKKDENLDADDDPQRLAQGHAAEAIIIEMEHAGPESLFRFKVIAHGLKN